MTYCSNVCDDVITQRKTQRSFFISRNTVMRSTVFEFKFLFLPCYFKGSMKIFIRPYTPDCLVLLVYTKKITTVLVILKKKDKKR